MRIPVAVQIKPFDLEHAQPQIDTAREAFAHYLDDVPRKSTRSKHGLMGPVGKILGEVKSGRRDAASLKGYAIRVHEATGKSPSRASLEALEKGIDSLIGLLAHVPVTAHDRLLDRLDYGLYFDLRKKAAESKEARRQAWIGFLRERYGTESALSDAWGKQVASFDDDRDTYLPPKSEGATGKKATARQRDVAAFWELQGAGAIAEEEDEE